MEEEEQLHRLAKWRAKSKPDKTVRLGQVIERLVDRRISPRQERFGAIVDAWDELLPAELSRHCRIVDIQGGQLKALADSPSYMYELQLCSSGILEELRRKCPGAKISRIKFVVG